ncbi:MAG: hypothetical protein J3R72DRAFT_461563 [Linnemannia gamsii]|nr:MAG: hypothetical protein J3R72DRAFT_461563 [Linnemannia gamsii]
MRTRSFTRTLAFVSVRATLTDLTTSKNKTRKTMTTASSNNICTHGRYIPEPGVGLCIWDDAEMFKCPVCCKGSTTSICISSATNGLLGPLPEGDCCPLIRSIRMNRAFPPLRRFPSFLSCDVCWGSDDPSNYQGKQCKSKKIAADALDTLAHFHFVPLLRSRQELFSSNTFSPLTLLSNECLSHDISNSMRSKALRQTSFPLPAVLDGVNLDHEFMREHVNSVMRPSSHDITFLAALLSLQSPFVYGGMHMQ